MNNDSTRNTKSETRYNYPWSFDNVHPITILCLLVWSDYFLTVTVFHSLSSFVPVWILSGWTNTGTEINNRARVREKPVYGIELRWYPNQFDWRFNLSKFRIKINLKWKWIFDRKDCEWKTLGSFVQSQVFG